MIGGQQPRGASSPPDGASPIAEVIRKVTSLLPGGGEERPGQVQMAEAVAGAIDTDSAIAVQAGTGTGKSLAYLVPAIVSGRKVVIATATKALQDQLARKDLPFLREALPQTFTWALLKGRSNYVCRQKVREVSGRDLASPEEQLPFETEGSPAPRPGRFVDDLKKVIRWSHRSPTGDAAELDFEPDPRVWSALSTSSRECPGASKCPSGSSCFAEIARQHAARADVVVVNTHLYGAHLAADSAVLPDHDVVVFDEAHQLEDVAAAAMGIEVASGSLRSLGRQVRTLVSPEDREKAEAVTAAGDLLDEAARRFGNAPIVGKADDDLTTSLITIQERLRAAMAAVRSAEGASAGAVQQNLSGDDTDPARVAARHRAIQESAALDADLSRLAAPGSDDVIWVEGPDRTPVVKLAPVDVAGILSRTLWPHLSAVLTSATLPQSLMARLGLDTEVLDVGSPFPHRENALLYCAAHLPRPVSRDAAGVDTHERAVHRELRRLIDASRGRALVLFTSWRAMRSAADNLAGDVPYPLLVQGELSKPELLRRFAAEGASCLFATMSFWQGVDVPGEALSMVVIDRIPFPRPDEPLMMARRNRAGDGAFRLVDIPRAATLLAQGAGRLIRSASDRGVVAVLDSRLATAGYRHALLAAVPPMRRTVTIEDVEAFFRGSGGATG